MACGDVGEIELLKHAVLRAAAWPIETVYDFRAPALARAASALLGGGRSVLARREATVAALHAAVPRFDQVTRAYLLSVKRHVHGQIGELPKPTPWVSAQLSADTALARLIDEEGAARKALAEQSLEFECMYAAELQRQRCVLRTKIADPRFLKALVIANPLVAARWTGAISRIAGGGQKERRLERTVFRYLMRAVGRPTPHCPWADVSPISPATARAPPSP